MSQNIQIVHYGTDGGRVCFSYGVPVAAYVPGVGFVKTGAWYSTTTSKHANQFAGHDSAQLDDAAFRALIAPLSGVA